MNVTNHAFMFPTIDLPAVSGRRGSSTSYCQKSASGMWSSDGFSLRVRTLINLEYCRWVNCKRTTEHLRRITLHLDALEYHLFLASDAFDLPHRSCLRSYPRLWRGSARGCLLYTTSVSPRRKVFDEYERKSIRVRCPEMQCGY